MWSNSQFPADLVISVVLIIISFNYNFVIIIIPFNYNFIIIIIYFNYNYFNFNLF